jgi:hypothetical protein
MLELTISRQHDLEEVASDHASPAATRQLGYRAKSGVPLIPGKVGLTGLSPSTILGSILREVAILPVLLAGLALLVSGLVPGLFIAFILLLIGLAPILLVVLAIMLTEGIKLPGDSLKRDGDLKQPDYAKAGNTKVALSKT